MRKLSELFRPDIGWANAEGAWPEIVFSTRVRFARNAAGRAFPQRAEPRELAAFRQAALEAARGTRLFTRGVIVKTDSADALARAFLIERHHISHNLASEGRPSAVAVSQDEGLSVMINEEDHLRVQSIASGFALDKAYARAEELEEALGRELPYAWSSKFGFLTACPTNVGTGMRASCLVHLPALSRGGRMPQVLESLSHLGITARGIYGEGTYVLGDFYQISNSTCLGRSEAEFRGNLDRVIRNLINQEILAREKLVSAPLKLRTEDGVWRAYGVLRHARLLSYSEFMQNLSLVRMGVSMGMAISLDYATLNQLTLQMQPAHLQAAAGRALSDAERDAERAARLRKRLP